MSQDIVERLREPYWSYGTPNGRMLEAADEIVKLRQQVEQLQGRLAVYDKNLRGRRTDTPDYCIALIKERDILRQQRDELAGLVKRYLEETPLGHQPHMIAHIAEAALAKIDSTQQSAQGEKS